MTQNHYCSCGMSPFTNRDAMCHKLLLPHLTLEDFLMTISGKLCLLYSFYDYKVLKEDAKPLPPYNSN